MDRVLRSGRVVQGPKVLAFERNFSEMLGGCETVAVNSGTSALHLGLVSAGVGPGDEVIVPAFSFAASANAVALAGATPVFADVDPKSFCLDPASVEAKLSKRTVGIMLVHLFGHPAPIAPLRRIAEKNSLLLFEDAAQAHGAEIDGESVGNLGEFSAFSFYPTKNMSSIEGGMVATSNPELARKVRLLRNQGMEKRYFNEMIGFNNRMSDVHAAVGIEQLRRLEMHTRKRIENASYLSANLRGISVPFVASGSKHVFHQYSILVPEDRPRFQELLDRRWGVQTEIYYPKPLNKLPSFRHLPQEPLPVSEQLSAQILSIPVHPGLGRRGARYVTRAVNSVARSLSPQC